MLGCRPLAVAAWTALLGLFVWGSAFTIGHPIGGIAVWTLPAWATWRITLRWWARVGAPLPAAEQAVIARLWLACIALAPVGYGATVALGAVARTGAKWADLALLLLWIALALPMFGLPVYLSVRSGLRSAMLTRSSVTPPRADA